MTLELIISITTTTITTTTIERGRETCPFSYNGTFASATQPCYLCGEYETGRQHQQKTHTLGFLTDAFHRSFAAKLVRRISRSSDGPISFSPTLGIWRHHHKAKQVHTTHKKDTEK